MLPSLDIDAAVRVQAAHADADRIDTDGLPHVGAVAYPDQAYYSALDQVTGALASTFQRWHSGRPVMHGISPGWGMRSICAASVTRPWSNQVQPCPPPALPWT